MPPAINLIATESFADGHPWEQYAWLRDNAPVYRHSDADGNPFWALTTYDDVRAVSRQPTSTAPTPEASWLPTRPMKSCSDSAK